MKNKKIIKLLLIVFVISLLFTSSNVSQAALVAGGGASTGGSSGEIPTTATIGDNNDLKDLGGIIIGIIQWVGSAVAVIVIVVIGIKYMIASVEERAEYKKTATYYVIGAVLVFAGINILSIIYNIFN